MMHSRAVSIFGAGAWGSALAHVLQSNDISVRLWNRTQKAGTIASMVSAAPDGCELIIAISVQHTISVCQAMVKEHIRPRICWIASKGLDSATGNVLSLSIEKLFPNCTIGVLSGPNIANEITQGLPCGITLACKDAHVLSKGRDLFKKTQIITDTCDDLIGVQWWSALKNIMAIGYGLLQQSTLGHNMSATFLTMAAKEINAIVAAKGGKAATALSFSGIGDLVLTSHCPASRNRSYGQSFPQTPTHLVEGLATLQALRQHTFQCADWNLDTPVIQTIARVLDGTLCIKKFPNTLIAHATA